MINASLLVIRMLVYLESRIRVATSSRKSTVRGTRNMRSRFFMKSRINSVEAKLHVAHVPRNITISCRYSLESLHDLIFFVHYS